MVAAAIAPDVVRQLKPGQACARGERTRACERTVGAFIFASAASNGPNDEDAFVQVLGALPQWVLPDKLVNGALGHATPPHARGDFSLAVSRKAARALAKLCTLDGVQSGG